MELNHIVQGMEGETLAKIDDICAEFKKACADLAVKNMATTFEDLGISER